jgi:hypothetical protein
MHGHGSDVFTPDLTNAIRRPHVEHLTELAAINDALIKLMPFAFDPN